MSAFKRKVLDKFERREDLEIHVSQVTADGMHYAEIREYLPSLDTYGRGILIPQDGVNHVVSGLLKTKRGSK
jgi:hypothetical protein